MFAKYFKDNNKWYGTSINFFLEAKHYGTTRKTKFDIETFLWNFYEIEKKGPGYVVGNLERKKINN